MSSHSTENRLDILLMSRQVVPLPPRNSHSLRPVQVHRPSSLWSSDGVRQVVAKFQPARSFSETKGGSFGFVVVFFFFIFRFFTIAGPHFWDGWQAFTFTWQRKNNKKQQRYECITDGSKATLLWQRSQLVRDLQGSSARRWSQLLADILKRWAN